MLRRFSLYLEALEDRLVPATYGISWPDAAHLTLSFAPDGTDVAGASSDLYKTLDAQAPTASWQREILRAFQTWASEANINIGLVPDSGRPFGTTGAVQGSPHFGDIRVGAHASSEEALGTATPFDWTGTTWSGDVLFNSRMGLGVGSKAAADLFTVALHEAGHVLGFAHDPSDTGSIMFEDYLGPRTGLSLSDITALHALYGARKHDSFDLQQSNNRLSSATSLGPLATAGTTIEADLSTPSDVDVFKFRTPDILGLAGTTITLTTSEISFLTAKVTVYDALGQVVASSRSKDPQNGDLSLEIDNPGLNKTYFIKVEKSASDVFAVGNYRLEIGSVYALTSTTNLLTSTVNQTTATLANVDLHTNDSPETASTLGLTQHVFQTDDPRFDAAYRGSIHDSSDLDYYKLHSPDISDGSSQTLIAMVWATDAGDYLASRIHLYDQSAQPVAINVINNHDGSYAIQLLNASSNVDYFLQVTAADQQGAHNIGNYFLAVGFHAAPPVVLQDFAAGSLTQDSAQQEAVLAVNETTLFHFVLSAQSSDCTVQATVTMTIFDEAGHVILSLTATTGEPPVTSGIYLKAGTFRISYEARSIDGSPLSSTIFYDLDGKSDSDPVGAYQSNTTNSSTGSSSSSSGSYTYSGSSSTSSTQPASSPQYY